MKNWMITAACIAPFFAAAQAGNFYIKGKIKNWTASDTVRLTYYEGNKAVVDSIAAINGQFSFKGKIEQPAKAYLYLLHPNPKARPDALTFYLEAANITIEGTDSIRHASLKGSRTEEDDIRYKKTVEAFNNKMLLLRQQAMTTTVEQRKEPAFKALEADYAATRDSIRNRISSFIRKNPASFLSLELLENLAGAAINYNEIAPQFNLLAGNIRNTPAGKEFSRKLAIAKTTGVGVVAPAFSSFTTTGDSLSLQAVVKKGKLTLVDFWASWCKPCRAENPNVVKAYNAFHEKGFNILSVSLDAKAEPWKAAIEKDGMPWFHVSSLKYWNEPIAALYGVSGVPDNFLLDEQGRILARGLRGEALYKMIEKQLNKN